jgi:hypothetical protein
MSIAMVCLIHSRTIFTRQEVFCVRIKEVIDLPLHRMWESMLSRNEICHTTRHEVSDCWRAELYFPYLLPSWLPLKDQFDLQFQLLSLTVRPRSQELGTRLQELNTSGERTKKRGFG